MQRQARTSSKINMAGSIDQKHFKMTEDTHELSNRFSCLKSHFLLYV